MNAGTARQVARILCLALTVTLLTWPGQANAASECQDTPEHPATRPVAPPGVGADLPAPFTYRPNVQEHIAALRDTIDIVRRQAADLGVEACYREKPAEIASRVQFLSPFEFLVMTMFEHEPGKRDALLNQYQTDPQAAIKGLGEAFPSTSGQATLTTLAYYDVASDRIRVNAAQVPSSELRRVLVHEFWHAMPMSRAWPEQDGRTRRADFRSWSY